MSKIFCNFAVEKGKGSEDYELQNQLKYLLYED